MDQGKGGYAPSIGEINKKYRPHAFIIGGQVGGNHYKI